MRCHSEGADSFMQLWPAAAALRPPPLTHIVAPPKLPHAGLEHAPGGQRLPQLTVILRLRLERPAAAAQDGDKGAGCVDQGPAAAAQARGIRALRAQESKGGTGLLC